MGKSSARLRTYIGWLLASAFVIVAACFAVNCLIDPLWYLRGNVLTGINYPIQRAAGETQPVPAADAELRLHNISAVLARHVAARRQDQGLSLLQHGGFSTDRRASTCSMPNICASVALLRGW